MKYFYDFDTLRALVALPRGFPMKIWKILLFPKGQVEIKEEKEGNKICGTRCNRPSSNSFFFWFAKGQKVLLVLFVLLLVLLLLLHRSPVAIVIHLLCARFLECVVFGVVVVIVARPIFVVVAAFIFICLS